MTTTTKYPAGAGDNVSAARRLQLADRVADLQFRKGQAAERLDAATIRLTEELSTRADIVERYRTIRQEILESSSGLHKSTKDLVQKANVLLARLEAMEPALQKSRSEKGTAAAQLKEVTFAYDTARRQLAENLPNLSPEDISDESLDDLDDMPFTLNNFTEQPQT